jgi:hypothetical protein
MTEAPSGAEAPGLPPYSLGAHASPPDARDLLLEGSDHLAAALADAAARPQPFAPTTAAELAAAAASLAGSPPPTGTLSPLPVPYDQNGRGWCVAEAVTGAAAYLWHRKLGVWLFDQRGVGDLYALAKRIDGIAGEGTTPRAALYQAQHVGILGVDGKRYKIGPYHSLLPSSSPQLLVEQTIGVLAQPVILAVTWPSSWMGAEYAGGILPVPTAAAIAASPGGHAVELWRYLSNMAPVSDCLRNSWGPHWGNGQGNAYARADALLALAFDLWTFTL